MLLDPFEEQLDLLTTPIQAGDGECGQGNVIGQEDMRLVHFGVVELNSSQRFFEASAEINAGEHHGLISDQSHTLIYRLPVMPLISEVASRGRDTKAVFAVRAVQPNEVDVAAIPVMECSALGDQQIEHIDVMQFLTLGDH